MSGAAAAVPSLARECQPERGQPSAYSARWFGYPAGFLTLAGIAVCALAFFTPLMLGTRTSGPAASPGASNHIRPAVA
ncbi:MAG TPA: hypothetical protein VJ779_04830 [Acetobacteraceae bacterium]|nr:hypothetical protein [Acetobacteraceae bacterium]